MSKLRPKKDDNPPVCANIYCQHPKSFHEHYRRGSDCSFEHCDCAFYTKTGRRLTRRNK